MNMTPEEMIDKFKRLYGEGGDIRLYFAPGRVNLIGEHIDYNGGHVFPCALTVGNYLVIRKRNDRKLRFFSQNYKTGQIFVNDLDSFHHCPENEWTNYPLGVIWSLAQKGYMLPNGFDAFVWGNIPGSGLSSSAAVELSFGVAFKDLYDLPLSLIDLALIGQDSENRFNGMNCGIMDQFASAMGKKDDAIFLDCATLSYEYVPLILKGSKIIVTNSNKPHSLVTSHYNERRAECESALKDLQTKLPIKNLCELTPEQFEENKDLIRNPVNKQRAKHAVYEEDRTKKAIVALQKNDLVTFGELLNQSGDSLRYDYDATCFEIDTLVTAARGEKGVYGSRETGGGWGGNTVSIVEDAYVDSFIYDVGKIYHQKTGLRASFAQLEVGDGARRIL